ncbi:MAG TPA: NUDIX domain-containing protein [Candidatus Poseidoniaceae archaeon]|nr:MAG TPA: NUDIX domain-containing protein [Candidatus Poseidoniales archaeon]HII37871.1 NUDIX domain-containing protein [Candidatus Poseidoniaceae archaeon]|tara:strand:+ start:1075 stop:1485 length:411 start_codon:yes stop_codon:yes gene_type:complete
METSCGVVLVNFGTILLLQYPQGHWDLPKGHIEANDSDNHATAARELAEETGISEIEFIEGFESETNYSFKYKGKRTRKQVYWYLATTEKITVKLSKEHRDYMWLDWELALDMATHAETKGVIKEAMIFANNHGLS